MRAPYSEEEVDGAAGGKQELVLERGSGKGGKPRRAL